MLLTRQIGDLIRTSIFLLRYCTALLALFTNPPPAESAVLVLVLYLRAFITYPRACRDVKSENGGMASGPHPSSRPVTISPRSRGRRLDHDGLGPERGRRNQAQGDDDDDDDDDAITDITATSRDGGGEGISGAHSSSSSCSSSSR